MTNNSELEFVDFFCKNFAQDNQEEILDIFFKPYETRIKKCGFPQYIIDDVFGMDRWWHVWVRNPNNKKRQHAHSTPGAHRQQMAIPPRRFESKRRSETHHAKREEDGARRQHTLLRSQWGSKSLKSSSLIRAIACHWRDPERALRTSSGIQSFPHPIHRETNSRGAASGSSRPGVIQLMQLRP